MRKYNLFVVNKTKPKPKPLPKAKPRGKLEGKAWGTKGEAPLTLENKKKFDKTYAKEFLRTTRK